MKDEEATGLCEQLRELIKAGPGINLPAQQRLDMILSYIAHEFACGSCVYERVAELRASFAVWFHPRRLIAPDADAIQAMQSIHAHIDGLEQALGAQRVPETVPPRRVLQR